MVFHSARASSRAALALVLLLAACGRPSKRATMDQAGSGPAPTPAPPFASIDAATHGEILAYARGLRYDTRTGVSDSQALAVANRPGGKCPAECSYGAVARINPEVGALGLGGAELKVGRIVARIVSEDDKAYEKFNLGPRDTVYVWADSAAGARGRLISTDPGRFERSKKDVRMILDPHQGEERYAQSTARFLWAEDDEHMWVSCQSNGCCKFIP